MLDMISNFLTTVDDFVWGIPLIVLILATGLFLTARLHFLQITKLPHAIKHLIANEKSGEDGEVSSFAALCTALSATIGTGNIVGVATAIVAGGPGALFWMQRTDTSSADPSTISRTVWARTGNGWRRSSLLWVYA